MNENDLMSQMKISKAVATMAIPSVISSLVTVVYNMADTFFVGQTGDPLQVAAVSLTNPIFIYCFVGQVQKMDRSTRMIKKLEENRIL